MQDSISSINKEEDNSQSSAPKEIIPVNFDKLLSDKSEEIKTVDDSLLAAFENRAPSPESERKSRKSRLTRKRSKKGSHGSRSRGRGSKSKKRLSNPEVK